MKTRPHLATADASYRLRNVTVPRIGIFKNDKGRSWHGGFGFRVGVAAGAFAVLGSTPGPAPASRGVAAAGSEILRTMAWFTNARCLVYDTQQSAFRKTTIGAKFREWEIIGFLKSRNEPFLCYRCDPKMCKEKRGSCCVGGALAEAIAPCHSRCGAGGGLGGGAPQAQAG